MIDKALALAERYVTATERIAAAQEAMAQVSRDSADTTARVLSRLKPIDLSALTEAVQLLGTKLHELHELIARTVPMPSESVPQESP